MLRIEVVHEGKKEYGDEPFSQPADVFLSQSLQKEFRKSDREKFIAVHLNSKNQISSYEVVSIGTLNSSLVHPREVFKGAILSNAASVILCHNHPSGHPEPSDDDIALTKRLEEVGTLLGIEVLDHIIFAGDNFYSFKAETVLHASADAND